MKILLIGPVHLYEEFIKQKGKYPFVKGQGQQSWVEALEELGHTVKVFRYTDTYLFPSKIIFTIQTLFHHYLPRWYARSRRIHDRYYRFSLENIIRNRKLSSLAMSFNPDIILFSGGTTAIFPSVLLTLKSKLKCKLVVLSGTDPFLSATVTEKELIKSADIVAVNDCGFGENWRTLGAKDVLVLPISSVDPKIHRKLHLTGEEKRQYASDICFVGTLTPERQEVLGELTEYNIKIWGDILPEIGLNKRLRHYYQGTARREKMVKIYNAAKICINLQPTMKCGGNMRTFEIAGSGGFQIVDKVDRSFFIYGKEIVTFSSKEELKKKVEHYLSKEQERIIISEAGYRRAHEEHTYKKHFEKLLAYLYEKN